MLNIIMKICHIRIDRHLILPLKLGPHLPELCVCTCGRDDVVHDVNVDIIQHYTVTVITLIADIVH
jgi:hypothetical protein